MARIADGFIGYRGVALVKPQSCGDERGNDQQDDEDIRELSQKLSPCGYRCFGRQLVLAVAFQAFLRLLPPQT